MSDEICRDFEKGDCRRGQRCKFFHPKLRICKDFQNKKCERETCRFLHVTREEEESYDKSGVLPEHLDETEAKRNRIMAPSSYGGGIVGGQDFGGYGKRRREDNFNMMPAIPPALLQENEMLKQKVTELQRQVTDLRQMNDTLYEQNTAYRNQLRGTTVQPPTMGSISTMGISDMVANGTY